ncbi:hypothetical protein PILCRDRAFT_811464 [Piloderma croceum F 1598]|uniref:Uncharacterized protein n=1 Tax=Piloderma croceum (strain F 1598) TaxID=765440 RepID=A0A0C3GH33_PILCF|nr:hypothetical protein PILCRDRAFT_811464 [Piloderma croceum F 1598]
MAISLLSLVTSLHQAKAHRARDPLQISMDHPHLSRKVRHQILGQVGCTQIG